MSSRLLSFVIWAAVAASAAFWGLRLFTKPAPAPAHAQSVALAASTGGGDLTRLLGAAPVAPVAAAAPVPVADNRFKLVGVVAPRQPKAPTGLALISVDGKPAKPHGLGAVVDGSLVLLSVSHRRAELGERGGAASVTLELPAVPEPSRATRLPSADGSGTPGFPPAAQTVDPAAVPQTLPPGFPQAVPPPAPPGMQAVPPAAPRTAPMPPGTMRLRQGQGAAS